MRKGTQVTIVTYGTMVYVCEAAARSLGLDAEIIDVRTMVPLDVDTICTSVKKTGRCLIAHEATRFSGFGAELSATIQEECFWNLEAPIQRVAGWDTPYPHAFEWEYFPGPAARRRRPQGRDGDAMSRYVFKMPDLGEGTVEAEIVAWHVKVGDHVAEDQVMAEVMTEKAAVEVPAPVTGRVVSLAGGPGDMVARRRRAGRVRDGGRRRRSRSPSRPASAVARRRLQRRSAPSAQAGAPRTGASASQPVHRHG